MRDPEIRGRLERLRPPARRPGFEEELWERIADRERASARRWRRSAAGLAALAVAAVASTAVVATAQGGGSTLDRTVSCRVRPVGDVPGIVVGAQPRQPGAATAGLQVEIADGTPLLAVADGVTGFELDGADCRSSALGVPLATDGLPLAGSYAAGGFGRFQARCFPPGRVLLRLRLTLDRDGRPLGATVAVRDESGGTLMVVRWSPSLALAHVDAACPVA